MPSVVIATAERERETRRKSEGDGDIWKRGTETRPRDDDGDTVRVVSGAKRETCKFAQRERVQETEAEIESEREVRRWRRLGVEKSVCPAENETVEQATCNARGAGWGGSRSKGGEEEGMVCFLSRPRSGVP
jgi:hypothetical protein